MHQISYSATEEGVLARHILLKKEAKNCKNTFYTKCRNYGDSDIYVSSKNCTEDI
jgi:hypothetical protein